MNSRVAIIPNATLDAFGTAINSEAMNKPSSKHENACSLSFLTLPHPRTGYPALFLPFKNDDPENTATTQILEVQAVDPPASRSWFMDDDIVLEDGRLLLMTPIDPAFLLLPVLRSIAPVNDTANFRTLDDIFSLAATKLSHGHDTSAKSTEPSIQEVDVLHLSSLDCILLALSRLCETKELDGNVMVYRFSLPKVIEMLRIKAARLATPEMVTRIRPMTRSLALDGLGPTEDIEETLREAGRMKLACDVLSQYLPADIYEALLASHDFGVLNKYVRSIRDQDLPSKPITKASSSMANGKGAEGSKKRKAETQSSRGAQKLLKTDTSKMQKLTSFFGKKPA